MAQLTQGTTVANMDFEEITFLRPVLAGDTLYTRTVVLDKRLSRSRPGKGVVRFEHTAVNQRDVVAVAQRAALMRCRDGDA